MKKLCLIICFLLITCPVWGGVDFDKVDDYIDIGQQASLRTNDFTAAFWFKPGSVDAVKNSAYTNVPAVGSGGFALNVDHSTSGNSAGEVIGWLYDGSAWQNSNHATNVLTAGVWVHLAIAFTDHATFRIYVNGVQANARLLTGKTVSYGSSVVSIGRDAAAGNWLHGVIDEAYQWSTELTAPEMLLLYKARVRGIGYQIQPASLVGYWPLDDEEDGTSGDGDLFVNRANPGTADGTGVDGGNNSGLTAKAGELSTSP